MERDVGKFDARAPGVKTLQGVEGFVLGEKRTSWMLLLQAPCRPCPACRSCRSGTLQPESRNKHRGLVVTLGVRRTWHAGQQALHLHLPRHVAAQDGALHPRVSCARGNAGYARQALRERDGVYEAVPYC